jgi:enterochelin esterase family protein
MRRSSLLPPVVLAIGLAIPSPMTARQPTAPAETTFQAAGARGAGRGAVLVSPEVAADGRVTFRLRAPNAKDVAVVLGATRLPMQKDDQGVWSATTDVLAPNYYTYSLIVDGTSIPDPSNRQMETSFGTFRSMFVVPGADPWLPAPGIAPGAVARHRFRSAIANDDRDFFVYTPPGYDPRRSRPYPTVYLLHGLGDDAERWMNGGAANVILDNLIAQRKAPAMVLVTTLGYGVSNGPAGARSADNISGYARILLDEVLPAVERGYHVSRRRDDRAIAGLSMGGAEAVFTGLKHLDRFAWIGSFSGAFVMWRNAVEPGATSGASTPMSVDVFEKTFPALDAKANASIRLLWITCGTADALIGVNRQFKDWLRSKTVRFTEEEADGVGHVWPYWRRNFAEFAQKVFRR